MEDATATQRAGAIRDALHAVRDPEIPPLSVVELGIIADVRIEGTRAIVEMMPTFAGCPALDVMKQDILQAMREVGEREPEVRVVYDPPWTTERITPEGLRKLHEFGLAPPGPRTDGQDEYIQLQVVKCPFCGSMNTALESPFGPTLCRSIHYCNACLQSFEHFKPVG